MVRLSEEVYVKLITFPLTEERKPAIKKWNELKESVPHEGEYYGVLTGAAAGLFVVDLDRKGGNDGIAELAKLGEIPNTCTVRTRSGGLHLYFLHPGGLVPTNSSVIAPGIDIRGDKNGYVVGPGS